jgi:hypothetical protein
VIVKLTVDPDPEVREAAFTALGAIMKAVGKSAATPLLGEVAQDKLKMAKVRIFMCLKCFFSFFRLKNFTTKLCQRQIPMLLLHYSWSKRPKNKMYAQFYKFS